MKFGLQHSNFTFDGQGAEIVEKLRTLTQRAESLGFDSFWVMDHFHQIRNVGEVEEPMLEGWTTQSVVAGFTNRIKKLGVLREHCRSVGRDYDSILKTKLGHVVIDKNQEKITAAIKDLPEERRRKYAIYGTPEEVRKQIEAFRDVGLEYLVVNLEPDRELQALDLFASEVLKKL